MPKKARAKKKVPSTSRKARKAEKKTINTTPLYVILVVAFVLYLLFQSSPGFALVLGVVIFFMIIAILIIEISNGFKEEGYAKNIIEIVIAVVLVLVFWFTLRYLLNTAYPLDVVPSCSMLPVLNRGDMILLQGANQKNLVAPIVNATQSEWSQSFGNVNTESLQCVAYNQTSSGVKLSQIILPGYTVGLLKNNGGAAQIVPYSSQSGDLVKYVCGEVNVSINGTIVKEASTTAIMIGNTSISGDRNNSIVVYQTLPQDEFYKEGDSYIVHRVYAIVNVSGTYYTLTKGDNNPGLDIQYFNTPANMSQVGGKVIASVPYLGYLKLILSNNFVEPTGCNYTTQN